jgi:hypothetical protein
MLVDLVVPPVEQARPSLHASFDLPPRPHLAAVRWRIAGIDVTAGILAASHQVIAHGHFVETVACDVDNGFEVTDGAASEGTGHRFKSRIELVDRAGLDDLVRAHVDLPADAAVIGRFPTDPLAVTAVTRRRNGWDTIHTYPSAGGATVVHTRTEFRP